MSSVMRPSGPLPPRVYWTRRLVAVGLILVVMLTIWWLLGRVLGGGDQAQAAQQGPSTSTSTSGAGATNGAPTTGTHGGAAQSHQGPSSGNKQNGQQARHRRKHHGPASPSGPCAPTGVAMTVVAPDVRSGHSSVIRLQLTSLTVPACTLAVTPDSLALRIVSGQDLIWSSDSCPDQLPAKQLVVRRNPATVYTFTWDGRRSTDSCRGTGEVAKPGGYWAEAALIGADVHKAYFDVT